MKTNESFADLVNEVAAISFYGKSRMPVEYTEAVAKMEAHPEYAAYKQKLDAEMAERQAKIAADNKSLSDFLS